MSQHGQEDLQLEAARRHRMDGSPKGGHDLAKDHINTLSLVLADVADPRQELLFAFRTPFCHQMQSR